MSGSSLEHWVFVGWFRGSLAAKNSQENVKETSVMLPLGAKATEASAPACTVDPGEALQAFPTSFSHHVPP